MTDNNEVRGKAVLWRAPHGSGEKWMYFDHEPAHLPIRESLVSGADYAALQADLAAAIARAEAAEALAKAIGAEYNALILHMDSGGDFYEFQAAIAAQQADGEA